VLLSDAAMCALILWMLQGWLPPKWALLGAILAVVKLGIASYWMNSYWGGAMGGLVALWCSARFRGFAVFAVVKTHAVAACWFVTHYYWPSASRFWQTVVLTRVCCCVFRWPYGWFGGSSVRIPSPFPLRIRLRAVLLPVVVVLICTACAMAFYNDRTTGKPLLLPYTLNLRTYVTAPIFLWQHAKPALHYGNQQFEDFYNDWERADYQQTSASVRAVSLLKLVRLNSVFSGPQRYCFCLHSQWSFVIGG